MKLKARLIFNLWKLSRLLSRLKIYWICHRNKLKLYYIDEYIMGVGGEDYSGYIDFEKEETDGDPEIHDKIADIYAEMIENENRFDRWAIKLFNANVEREDDMITVSVKHKSEWISMYWWSYTNWFKDIEIELWE